MEKITVSEIPPIRLRTSSASLLIQPNEHAWSQVQFIGAESSLPLGAEALKYITTHLLDFLSDRTPGLRWVLTLSELHVSLYGEHSAEKAVLRLQDKNAKNFAEMVITDGEKEHWIQELRRHMPV